MQLKRAHWVQIAIVSGIALTLLAVVPAATVLNNKEGEKRLQRAATTTVSPFEMPSSFSGVALLGNISAIDASALSFRIHFTAVPVGSFDAQGPLTRINSDARLVIAGKETAFKSGSVIPAFDVVVPIDDGGPNRYPFDSYSATFQMTLVKGVSGFNESIPMAMALVGAVQSWSIDILLIDIVDSVQVVFLNVIARRSWTTKLFSVLTLVPSPTLKIIIVIMWALSLAVLSLAVTLWFRNRKVEPPTIAVTASLLFALPALRNSQPGAPPIGASVDVAGFMWNMVLVASACLLLLINYIVKYKKEKPAPVVPKSAGMLA
ncbi:hypothetical protein HK105_208718 [Polyrhizophydium stewartii]|uniref:DUF4436 domain-containing protein n=1 Tax=Polyrhizophydium stewartii TaxID=2732419 RepID=A0ABR4MX12_9FUNG|nr:hypothetical protein HK105_006541 [Polyrhizophydium stewartii]